MEFTLRKAANAVNVRASIPDSQNGKGQDATLGVFVNGHRSHSLALTSRYSWFYGQYPWSNNPADGGRRQLYDDKPLRCAIFVARDQWVAFFGVDSNVATTTSSTCSALIEAGRPGRGSSVNPSRRSSLNRARHLPTVGNDARGWR